MDWEFTEDTAFKSLLKAFKESEESSVMEFLASEGASYYLELMQNAAGEGIDLTDEEVMDEFQEELLEYLENK
tara:strand:- start:242 stop:460 length:219 start_codon:yes stop_codon:yes gene_type:complete